MAGCFGIVFCEYKNLLSLLTARQMAHGIVFASVSGVVADAELEV